MSDGIEIVLDTETTGISKSNDRICEIGAVEVRHCVPTGRTFHAYIDPKRPMPPEAEAVHGLSNAFLSGKPIFRQVVPGFLEFIAAYPLVAHNATFDIGFLNAELGRIGRDTLTNPVVDTWALARKVRPGQKNNLDILAKTYGVNTSKRFKHGALIDAEILAGIYLHLRGGPQQDLLFTDCAPVSCETDAPLIAEPIRFKRKVRITPQEFERHKAFVREMGPKAIWLQHEIYARHLRSEQDTDDTSGS